MKLVLFTSLAFKGWKKMSMRLVTGISMVFLLFSVVIACSTSRPVEEASTSNIKATVGPRIEHKQGSSGCAEARGGGAVSCGGLSSECAQARGGGGVSCGGEYRSRTAVRSR